MTGLFKKTVKAFEVHAEYTCTPELMLRLSDVVEAVSELKNIVQSIKAFRDKQLESTNWEPSKSVHVAESFLCADILKYIDEVFGLGEVQK